MLLASEVTCSAAQQANQLELLQQNDFKPATTLTEETVSATDSFDVLLILQHGTSDWVCVAHDPELLSVRLKSMCIERNHTIVMS